MYIYQANVWCDSCAEKIRADLEAEGKAPEDPSDEYTYYDSYDYPKGPYQPEATDTPEHCAAGADCLEGIDLTEYGLDSFAKLHGAETRTIGALLSEDLTAEGTWYVRSTFSNYDPTPYQWAVHTLWAETFNVRPYGYSDLRGAYSDDGDGDPWGSAMSAFFDVAGELYRRGEHIPTEWQFRPGALAHVVHTPDGPFDATVRLADSESLDRMGAVLNRYTDMLRSTGKDY